MKKAASVATTCILFLFTGLTVFVVSQKNSRFDTQLRASGTVKSTSVVMRVAGDTDMINQDGTVLEPLTGAISWLGTGTHPDASYLGMRFSGKSIPYNSTILSASLTLTSTSFQEGVTKISLFAEKSFQTLTFSASNPPSLRLLTIAQPYATMPTWNMNEASTFDVTAIIKDLFTSGIPSTYITLVIKGTDDKPNKKYFYNNRSPYPPQLTIVYLPPSRTSEEN